MRATGRSAGLVVNLQGDAPFTAPQHIVEIVRAARDNGADVTTPVVQLDWARLDALRAHKQTTPASGTTCIRAPDGRALWFSKTILPFMRNEAELRAARGAVAGAAAYRALLLSARGARSVRGGAAVHYERLEGLEQLRLHRARARHPGRGRGAGADHHERDRQPGGRRAGRAADRRVR